MLEKWNWAQLLCRYVQCRSLKMFNSEADNEEKWIEEEIQKELDQLDINSELVDDEHSSINEIHSEHNSLPDSSEVSSFSRSIWLLYTK